MNNYMMPSWNTLQQAWKDVGADIAGISWDAFYNATQSGVPGHTDLVEMYRGHKMTNQGLLSCLFREALSWGMTYGPEIPTHQWDEMRESMVKQYTDRAMGAAIAAGAVYAELPARRRAFLCTKCGGRDCEPETLGQVNPTCKCGYLGFAEDLDFTADDLRDFADRTHAIRAPHGQAPASVKSIELQIAEALRTKGLTLAKTATGYAVLKLGEVTAQQATPSPQADSVLEDAARYRWLRNKSTVLHNTAWLGGATAVQRDVDFLRRDDALAALDAAIDAARAAQEGKIHDN